MALLPHLPPLTLPAPPPPASAPAPSPAQLDPACLPEPQRSRAALQQLLHAAAGGSLEAAANAAAQIAAEEAAAEAVEAALAAAVPAGAQISVPGTQQQQWLAALLRPGWLSQHLGARSLQQLRLQARSLLERMDSIMVAQGSVGRGSTMAVQGSGAPVAPMLQRLQPHAAQNAAQAGAPAAPVPQRMPPHAAQCVQPSRWAPSKLRLVPNAAAAGPDARKLQLSVQLQATCLPSQALALLQQQQQQQQQPQLSLPCASAPASATVGARAVSQCQQAAALRGALAAGPAASVVGAGPSPAAATAPATRMRRQVQATEAPPQWGSHTGAHGRTPLPPAAAAAAAAVATGHSVLQPSLQTNASLHLAGRAARSSPAIHHALAFGSGRPLPASTRLGPEGPGALHGQPAAKWARPLQGHIEGHIGHVQGCMAWDDRGSMGVEHGGHGHGDDWGGEGVGDGGKGNGLGVWAGDGTGEGWNSGGVGGGGTDVDELEDIDISLHDEDGELELELSGVAGGGWPAAGRAGMVARTPARSNGLAGGPRVQGPRGPRAAHHAQKKRRLLASPPGRAAATAAAAQRVLGRPALGKVAVAAEAAACMQGGRADGGGSPMEGFQISLSHKEVGCEKRSCRACRVFL